MSQIEKEMPIKSLFLPPYALQGENIPAHIIWDDLEFRFIRIELPPSLVLKEIYNVAEEMVETHERVVVVKKTETKGYVGLLFSSKKVEEEAVKSQVSFLFVGENDTTISETKKTIFLFRPNLQVVDTPAEIRVDVKKGYVMNRIKVRNSGEGTLLVRFLSTEDSEIQIRTPDGMIEYRKRLFESLREKSEELMRKYPAFHSILKEYISIIERGWNNYTDLEEIRMFSIKFSEAIIKNDEFQSDFTVAVATSVLENMRFYSMPEMLLKYLDSIASKKVWLYRPEDKITVSPQSSTLKLEIMPSDRLLASYETVRLQDIRVVGTEVGEIEMIKLFEWM